MAKVIRLDENDVERLVKKIIKEDDERIESKIQLAPQFVDYLSNLPEQGMGYQIVKVKLKNGQVLKNRVVINSTYLKLNNNEEIDTDDIVSIKLYDDGDYIDYRT